MKDTRQFEKLLDEAAESNMTFWDLNSFKRTHKTLFRSIMEAMTASKVGEGYYKELSNLILQVEGEMIQQLYFFFKCLDLKESELGVKANDVPIPTTEQIEQMRKHLSTLFAERHDLFVREGLYTY